MIVEGLAPFLLFLAAAAAAGSMGVLFPPGAWYERLDKPGWRPPNRAFPFVWSALYVLMAVAGARVAGEPGAGLALAFWALQIALNAVWTPIFFGLRRMGVALAVIGLLWLAVLGALVTHGRIDLWAGLCFAPYLLWLSLAFALNLSVLRRNPGEAPLRPDRL